MAPGSPEPLKRKSPTGSKDKDSKTSFPSLPKELRDIIYEYHLAYEGPRVNLDTRDPVARKAALFLTCKQIYQEGIREYYQNSTFFTRSAAVFLRWATKIS